MSSPSTVAEETVLNATNLVLYDDACPLCTFQMKVITWLDWFHAISLLPLSHDNAAAAAKGLRREDLLSAIHCLTPKGAIHRGARAIRYLSFRLPLAIPIGLFLWIPGVIYIAERIYMWVSRNRQSLSRLFGCKGACSILPARERSGDVLRNPGEGSSSDAGS